MVQRKSLLAPDKTQCQVVWGRLLNSCGWNSTEDPHVLPALCQQPLREPVLNAEPGGWGEHSLIYPAESSLLRPRLLLLTTTPGHPWELGLEDATRTPRAPPSPPTSGSSAHLVLAEPQGRAL